MGVLSDKLNFVKRLEEGGFTRPHAETLSEVLHQAVAESFATKQDVEAVRQDVEAVRTEVAAVRVELQHDIGLLRRDVQNEIGMLRRDVQNDVAVLRREMQHDAALLRTEIKASAAETRVWAVGLTATAVAALASIKFFG